MASVLFVAAMLGIGAQASAHDARNALAEATHTVEPSVEQPKITDPPPYPDLKVRAAGDFTGTMLFAPDNVCGYVGGDIDAPWSCDPGDKCAYATAQGGWVACCSGINCSISQFDCVDLVEYSTSKICNSACAADPATRKCTDTDLPYCGTLTFFDGIVDYRCADTSSSLFEQAETTYDGYIGEYELTTVVFAASTTFTARSSSSSSTSSESSTSSTESTTTIVETATPTPTETSQPAAGPPIGAIVGGAVGGVALIALIAFGVWFIMSRKKKDAAAAAAAAAAAQQPQMQHPPAPMQSPYPTGGWQEHPGHASTYAPTYYAPSVMPSEEHNMHSSPAAGYAHDPTKPGYVSTLSPYPESQRQSFSQVPTHPSPPITHHTGSSPVYYEASGNPVGADDPNPNHRGQLHELS